MLGEDEGNTVLEKGNNPSLKQGEVGAVFIVPKILIREHERVILKQILQILDQDELVQPPLDKFPYKKLELPKYIDELKTRDATNTSYKMIQLDAYGEKKWVRTVNYLAVDIICSTPSHSRLIWVFFWYFYKMSLKCYTKATQRMTRTSLLSSMIKFW